MQVGQLQEPFCNNYLHVQTLQMKKVVLWTIAAAQVAENHGMRIDLVLMMSNIYINSNLNRLTKFTSSSRSTQFKDILFWNISQIITKSIPISTRIVISSVIKQGMLFEFDRKSMETETITWSEFPVGGKAIVEQILASEEGKKSKRAVPQSGIWVGKLTIWVRSFKIEKL